MRRRNETGGIMLRDLRLYYKATVIKILWCWHRDRNIDQWSRAVNLEINPHTYSQLIYGKIGKNIQWRKDGLFNKWCWGKWTATCKTMKLEHSLPYTEINSKLFTDLNIRTDTTKLLGET